MPNMSPIPVVYRRGAYYVETPYWTWAVSSSQEEAERCAAALVAAPTDVVRALPDYSISHHRISSCRSVLRYLAQH